MKIRIGDRVKYVEHGRYLSGMTVYVKDIVGDDVLVEFGGTFGDRWCHNESLVKAK